MYILSTGMDHKTAPIEIREKFVFADAEQEFAYQTLLNEKSILECVIISTCNRTEIFAVVDQIHTGRYYLKRFLASFFQVSFSELEPYLFFCEENDAVKHLFKVTAGLDSLVLGETQILGQVKNAFATAKKYRATGTIFNQLFKEVITFAKKVHHQTKINENAVSVSYAAVEVAKQLYGGTLKEKKVLLIGAGKMAELALENLMGSGAEDILIINRTEERAAKLAQKFHAQMKQTSELMSTIQSSDIVIVSTGADRYIVTEDIMRSVMAERKQPILMIDIALPRNIESACAHIPNVFLYDLDNLDGIISANTAERRNIVTALEQEIIDWTNQFYEWEKQLGVVPVIRKLREEALMLQEETMKSLMNKLPELTEREYRLIGKHMKSIINQILKHPISEVKEMATLPDALDKIEFFKQIFDLKTEDAELLTKPAQNTRQEMRT